MIDTSSPSKTHRSAPIPPRHNSGSKGLALAETFKELGVAKSFWILFEEKSVLI